MTTEVLCLGEIPADVVTLATKVFFPSKECLNKFSAVEMIDFLDFQSM